ncbi:hypothetical protein K443DRAFT_135650 [Laccaria amethystina LaAM-08-1]|uniref:NAD(P)-binding protein n=1 Tax=Laccaria amethystina LaAM-08-1 TaxID=1095629 RepID=A0A0C9X207_9AGAR|nr:hypothetical protein K443DRAFT_135650 [Laccaria amethystina LaAM-08-1]
MPVQASITPFSGTRVAIVTGGAQGIGKAMALRLASDGFDICVDDLASSAGLLDDVVSEIQQLGRKAMALSYDVTKENEVKKLVEETVAELGSLDLMVANAGIIRQQSIMEVLSANIGEWESVWAVNIRGVVLCYKYAAIQMSKQSSGGRILGASSVGGLQGFAGYGAYCASKAAVRSLTQTASLELSKYGISVNAYAPGIIESPMIGQPEQVANLVSYLASPESYFITGQTISF